MTADERCQAVQLSSVELSRRRKKSAELLSQVGLIKSEIVNTCL